tara:strand:+ start:3207 stop:3617 length:411 start_codon:yes stop_codon:yes gene_type:complete
MKKIFLTTLTTCLCLFASAQFSVISSINIPEEGEEFSVNSITDNMGAGYQINDKIMAGVVKNGENYDVFGRYYFENIYVSLQSPTEEMSENMNIGAGYSYNIWDKLYIEPNYSMPMKEDENGEREGKFVIGIAYKL